MRSVEKMCLYNVHAVELSERKNPKSEINQNLFFKNCPV